MPVILTSPAEANPQLEADALRIVSSGEKEN